ncbi:glycosyltransferase family 2 protein [Holophaga foetida]|uniref:glycosyltransferase family 2 protein n=1 Tax=Holophaga foetida TaxID=35839 RepID=UPI0002473B3D|nr:glycosyltransferase family 2 protein [Holophaga foetida]
MRTSCIINNYNYNSYIIDAIKSALAQSVPFDEIIVVDDGSTDESLHSIRQYVGNHERVKIIAKQNQGQLSCFNEGFSSSIGDIIFFLDADDLYEPDYLKEALAYYENHPQCDFLFFAMQTFGTESRCLRPYDEDKDLGTALMRTLHLGSKRWVGSPTSANSIRRSILEELLPMPEEFLKDWKTRADDCLVWGAAMLGARKCYCDKPLVRYRLHQNNNFYGRKFPFHAEVQRLLVVNRFFSHMGSRYAALTPYDMYRITKREFKEINKPSIQDMRDYSSTIISLPLSIGRKIETIAFFTRKTLQEIIKTQLTPHPR